MTVAAYIAHASDLALMEGARTSHVEGVEKL
jgi:hypothetical protein